MKVYGRFLSPFTRRVMITLNLQGRAWEHQPIMVTGPDFERVRQLNPLGRVPALELDDGRVLADSGAIVDYLEDTTDKRTLPVTGPKRHAAMQTIALAVGATEKAVALVYERQRRPEQYHWADWQARLETQIVGGLDALETETPAAGFFGGAAPDGVDVAVVCLVDFVSTMHPHLLTQPKLKALAERANALPAFETTHPKHTK